MLNVSRTPYAIVLVVFNLQGIIGTPWLIFIALDENGAMVRELAKNPGDSLVLSCLPVVRGLSTSVHWSRDGKILNQTIGMQKLNLSIENLTENHSGIYRCGGSVVNHNGNDWDVFLTMNTPPQLIHGQGFFTPSPQVFYIGDTPLFNCYASGKPKPTIQWFFNNQLLADGDMYDAVLIAKKTNGVDLKMIVVEKKHSGVLRCQASNKLGHIAHNISLTVKSLSEDMPIKFTTSRRVYKSKTELICLTSAVSLTRTDVFWTFKKEPIVVDSKKYHTVRTNMAVQGNAGFVKSVLIIDDVIEKDDGKYICAAVNSLGVSQASVPLMTNITNL